MTALHGSTALVTGAGRGIGRAVALGLANAGVTVALVARSLDQLTQTAEEITLLGEKSLVVPADLGGDDPARLRSAIERVLGELGAVDILVNNAAVVAPLGPSARVAPPSGPRRCR